MASTELSAELPNFLFDAWRFRQHDLSEARERDELNGWNVSSLCSAYLKYQLDRHELQSARREEVPPSLISVTTGQILKHLSLSNDVQADTLEIAENLSSATLLHLLRDPRTPYKVLRDFDSLPHTIILGGGVDRRLIDIDEAVLASERFIRNQETRSHTNFLVSLTDLASILGQPDANGFISFKRKTPPKGGFEFLDVKRKQVIELHGSNDSFVKTFDRVTYGILKGLDWSHVFIAGGMVLNTLLHTDPSKDDQGNIAECDIDLYLYDLTPEEATKKVEEIYNCWITNNAANGRAQGPLSDIMVLKSSRTINFIPKYPNRRVQIVLKLLSSPLDILLNFDLDACALGFDGSQVVMLPRCARALETGYSVFTMDIIWGHHLGNRRETQEIRVFKYADRGFGLRMLPSYVRSLEEKHDLEGPPLASSLEGKSKATSKRTGPTRIVKGENGLKTLKRIAYLAQQFVQKFYLEGSNPLVKTIRSQREELFSGHWGNILPHELAVLEDEMTEDEWIDEDEAEGDTDEDASADPEKSPIHFDEDDLEKKRAAREAVDKMDNLPIIRLCAIDGYSMHEAFPDGRKGLGVFELLMRHCEAWRLDAVGEAWLDRDSFSSITYDDTSEYHGLPTYKWGRDHSYDFQNFDRLVDDHNNALFRLLRMTISDRVNIHHRVGSFVNYLTRRIRRLIVGQYLKGVQEKQITIPLVIPADLQTTLTNELQARQLPDSMVSQLLIPVHDPSKHDPRTATVPSLQDNATESGNLRYWLVTNDNMWAGQDRVLDEVAELLTALADWFAHCGAKSDPSTWAFNPGTDNDHCIWHLANMFRRRLVLPELSDKPQRGQILGSREGCLFRAWALTTPPKVERGFKDDERVMAKFQKELAKAADVPDHMFWAAGDEGTWGDGEGVPVWRD
ncbi:MAG: hypothetical protein Q9218_004414 [Villophora microphyllina]